MTRTSAWPILILASVSVWAQTSANLSGDVADATGAVMQGASVTITNSATGAERETATDSAGRYQFASLPVGEYRIRVAKSGFADQLRTGVVLAVGEAAIVNFTLAVGQASQAVTVNADAPLVEATTADISGL